ncbi:MAG: M48 family metallopeptidase [Bdellovibrio sp.]|nr:M48 family metallopeptidase [Methylotenera sp.]
MKFKTQIFVKTWLIASIFAANSAMAVEPATPNATLSGKPYSAPTNLDTSLPDLGDISQTVLTPQDEERIGAQIMRDVSNSDEVVQDIEIIDYLNELGNRLVAASSDKLQKFNFFVVQDNSINAFAMPGGVIGVHTGLIAVSNSESELASVLGHEIGHVSQHHLARMLASQKYDTFKNIAGIALALLVARSNPELANGALAASSAAGVQRQLDYTREHEREADRVGLSILDAAGFDVRAMAAFFTTLQRGTRFTEGTAPSFLRTHPLTAERISDVANRVESMPYRQVTDSLTFNLVKAKLRANTGLAQDAVEQFQDNIKDQRFANETAEHYGLAVAMLRKNDVIGAQNQMQWLRKSTQKNSRPNNEKGAVIQSALIESALIESALNENPMIETLAARIAVARNNPLAAATQYARGLSRFPAYRGLIYGYAEHFLAINQPDKAIKLVQDKQSVYPNDAYFYDVLAKAYALKNKNLLRFQAQGEAYYRQYNLQKAIEQMELAAKAKDGNFYEQSIVEARLKQLRRLEENEKLADKRLS